MVYIAIKPESANATVLSSMSFERLRACDKDRCKHKLHAELEHWFTTSFLLP